jgi:hypothetical protein
VDTITGGEGPPELEDLEDRLETLEEYRVEHSKDDHASVDLVSALSNCIDEAESDLKAKALSVKELLDFLQDKISWLEEIEDTIAGVTTRMDRVELRCSRGDKTDALLQNGFTFAAFEVGIEQNNLRNVSKYELTLGDFFIEVPGFPGQIIPPEARVWKVTGTKEASETLTDDGSAGKRREKNRARLT